MNALSARYECSRLLMRWLRWQEQLVDAPAPRNWKTAAEIAVLRATEEAAYRAWVRHRDGCESCRQGRQGEHLY